MVLLGTTSTNVSFAYLENSGTFSPEGQKSHNLSEKAKIAAGATIIAPDLKSSWQVVHLDR